MERFGDKVQCNPTVKLKKGKQYPLVDIDKIIPGYKFVSNIEVCDYNGQGGAKYQNRDVLMARITPCLENGKIALADIQSNEGIGSTELLVFRGIDGVSDTDYIYYLLNTKYMRQLAANSMTGASGRQRADLKFIKKIPWKFPTLKQQKEISAVLSQYDNLIVINKKRIKLLEATAQQLYKEWFVRFRFPGYETTKFVDGIPQGWEYGKISSFYDTTAGGTPSRVHSKYYDEGTIPWIKTGEIKDSIILETEEYITEEAIKYSAAKIMPRHSIIMAMYGVNIGYVGYLGKDMACNQAGCVFQEKNVQNSNHYLFQYLRAIREYLNGISFGAAQQNLSQKLIQRIKILMPDRAVLNLFNEKVDIIYHEIELLLRQNQNLTKQRDLLLPRLMSGKLAV